MKKIYESLFKRTETGAIQEWKQEQDNNRYRTICGQVGGKSVTSEWTEAVGKNTGKSNETSAIQQASAEIANKYKKQLKSGGYYKTVEEIDNESSFIQPMLAKIFIDRLDKIPYPVYVDRKYNGMRSIVTSKGQFTRKGEKIETAKHIFDDLKDILDNNNSIVLDGELYNHIYRDKLNEIVKLVRKTVHISPEDLKASKEKVKYYVYDGYGFGGITKETNFLQRREALYKLLKDIPSIVVVDCMKANNEKEVWEIYNSYIEENYEGAIVRLDKSYENRRSANLLKVKPEMDSEATILDIIEGNGNWSKTGKVVKLKWKDKIFDATLRGSYEEALQFLKDKEKWIGREVTFLYNSLTGLGIPNYARVDYANCIKEIC
jgi:DNA ligase-1